MTPEKCWSFCRATLVNFNVSWCFQLLFAKKIKRKKKTEKHLCRVAQDTLELATPAPSTISHQMRTFWRNNVKLHLFIYCATSKKPLTGSAIIALFPWVTVHHSEHPRLKKMRKGLNKDCWLTLNLSCVISDPPNEMIWCIFGSTPWKSAKKWNPRNKKWKLNLEFSLLSCSKQAAGIQGSICGVQDILKFA